MRASTLTRKKKQFIRPEGLHNLSVIPYLRGRLVFAELVARALEEDRFEQVVVDLPFFMNKGGMWEEAVKLFPRVSSLLIRREDNTFAALPFVPNDAACISLAAVKMLREWGRIVQWKCIDDSHLIHYPPEALIQQEIEVRDDCFAFTQGLEKYFSHLSPQLEELWKGLDRDQLFFHKYRAGLVLDRLKGCMKTGQKTLFVCEYRLWWLVDKILKSPDIRTRRYFTHTWDGVQGALVLEDPLDFWKRGILDDVPKIVERFYGSMLANTLNSYDKLLEIEALIQGTFNPAVMKSNGGSPSMRRALSFFQYMHNRLTSELRVTPRVINHLYDSACSCIGKKFARELVRRCLDYPYRDCNQIRNYYLISQNSARGRAESFPVPFGLQHTFLHTGNHQYSSEYYSHDMNLSVERRRLIQTVYKTLSRVERDSLSGDTGFSWEVREDFKFLEFACAKAREKVRRAEHGKRITKSWGSLGEGIDWKKTIASKAVHKDAIYIKTRINKNNDSRKMNEFTPTTFLFAEDMKRNGTMTLLDGDKAYLDYAAGILSFSEAKEKKSDYLESVFLTYSSCTSVYVHHIYKYHLSSITLLYTRGIIGPQRYNNEIKRPEKFQCRTRPLDDREINSFPLSEMGVAWAAKYADDSVLVIAKDGWKPSAELADYAKRKKVNMNCQSLSGFNPEFIERIRSFYLISTALEKHPDRDSIVKRFIE